MARQKEILMELTITHLIISCKKPGKSQLDACTVPYKYVHIQALHECAYKHVHTHSRCLDA